MPAPGIPLPPSRPSATTVDPHEIERQLQLEQQHINLLGDLATHQDKVRLKEIEIAQARLNGVTITDKEKGAILGLTSAQDSLNRAREALSILGDAATAAEQYRVRIQELSLALSQGKISQEQFARAVAAANPLFGEFKSVATEAASGFARDLAHSTQAMDALRSALDRVIDRLIDLAANKAITSLFNSFAGGLGSFFPTPSAMGNVFLPFAAGGVIDHPILFPMARGMGLAGEAGPEAIMPLMRRGSDGRLGVLARGGGTVDNRVTNVTVNVSTLGGSGDPREHEKLGKQVAHYVEVAVYQAILKQQRSGGLLAKRVA